MLKNILFIAMVILMAVGLVTVVRTIFFKILSPRNRYRVLNVIPLEGHIEDAEYILRCERHFKNRHEKTASSLVVVDCGMDRETYEICTILLKDGIIDGIYSPDTISLLYKG